MKLRPRVLLVTCAALVGCTSPTETTTDSSVGADTRSDGSIVADSAVDTGIPDAAVLDTNPPRDASADSGVRDTGVIVDSGVIRDSGVLVDSEVVRDTGVSPDSGVVTDGGVVTDSGVATDSGVVTDTGVVDPDSGATVDATVAMGTLHAELVQGSVTDNLDDHVATLRVGNQTLRWSASDDASVSLYAATPTGSGTENCEAVTSWAFSSTLAGTGMGEAISSPSNPRNECWRLRAFVGDVTIAELRYLRVLTPAPSVVAVGTVSRSGGRVRAIASVRGAPTLNIRGRFATADRTPIGESIDLCVGMSDGTCIWDYTTTDVPAEAASLLLTGEAVDSEGDLGTSSVRLNIAD